MLTYRLHDRPAGKVLWLSSAQWFIFTVANVITVPLVLGHAFGLSDAGTAMMTSRTLLLCGLVCLIQALVGHKFPIIEGPAGMWWGVFLILLQMSEASGVSNMTLLREMEMGLMAGSLVFILLSVFGWIHKVRGLFTPAVTGVFLILLAVQVSRSLLEGVLGVGFREGAEVKPTIVLLSLLLIGLTVGLMMKGKGILKNISVLIGLLVGWGVYAVLGLVEAPSFTSTVVSFPRFFPFGAPEWNWGVVITCAITSIILLSNLIASIQVFSSAADEPLTPSSFSRGSFMTGVGTFLAGLWGTVGVVPLTAASSLISLTGIASRLPFLISSGLIVALGLFPAAGQLFATIPAPVGYAVLFTVFGQLLGFGLRDIKSLPMSQRDIFVVGFSTLTGAGILFVQGSAWASLPPLFGFVLGNGLIVGVALAVILEHVVFRAK